MTAKPLQSLRKKKDRVSSWQSSCNGVFASCISSLGSVTQMGLAVLTHCSSWERNRHQQLTHKGLPQTSAHFSARWIIFPWIKMRGVFFEIKRSDSRSREEGWAEKRVAVTASLYPGGIMKRHHAACEDLGLPLGELGMERRVCPKGPSSQRDVAGL